MAKFKPLGPIALGRAGDLWLGPVELSGSSGGNRQKLSEKMGEMAVSGVMRKDKNAPAYRGLKERIKELVEPFGGTDQEIDQVYDHILAEMLGK